ncbi:MAG TPA: hypothetical protein PKW21_05970, partial [Rhabdaerophilum sp.]|nr:hypothetical protein [Rhabdaerophilum sp.]
MKRAVAGIVSANALFHGESARMARNIGREGPYHRQPFRRCRHEEPGRLSDPFSLDDWHEPPRPGGSSIAARARAAARPATYLDALN